MEEEFKPLEPCMVGPIKVKVLASGERGEAWRSPCPQLYINIGDTGVAIIGTGNIEKIRDMCNHALSNGPWDNFPSPPKKELCTPYTHKWIEAEGKNLICSKCGEKGKRLKDIDEPNIKSNSSQEAIHYKNYNKLKAEGKLDPKKNYLLFSGGGLG